MLCCLEALLFRRELFTLRACRALLGLGGPAVRFELRSACHVARFAGVAPALHGLCLRPPPGRDHDSGDDEHRNNNDDGHDHSCHGKFLPTLRCADTPFQAPEPKASIRRAITRSTGLSSPAMPGYATPLSAASRACRSLIAVERTNAKISCHSRSTTRRPSRAS